MTDTPPEFAEDVRKCAVVENGAEVYSRAQVAMFPS
jgi:hypothetical protein